LKLLLFLLPHPTGAGHDDVNSTTPSRHGDHNDLGRGMRRMVAKLDRYGEIEDAVIISCGRREAGYIIISQELACEPQSICPPRE